MMIIVVRLCKAADNCIEQGTAHHATMTAVALMQQGAYSAGIREFVIALLPVLAVCCCHPGLCGL